MAGAMGGNQLPMQVAANRPQMGQDNSMFMNFQNPQIQPPLSHGVPRMSMDGMNNGQFAIPPSSSPMNAGGDMSQRGNALMNPSGPMTPAQALGQQMVKFGNGGRIMLMASLAGSVTLQVSRTSFFRLLILALAD